MHAYVDNSNSVIYLNPDTAIAKDIEPLQKSIEKFFNRKKRKSENTYKNYKRYISKFFTFASEKELDELTWADILRIGVDDVEDYIEYCYNRGHSPQYIDQQKYALNSLYKTLERKHPDVSVEQVRMEKENTKDAIDGQYGALTLDEFLDLIEYIPSNIKFKPLDQKIFFLTLYATAHRVSAVLDLSPSKVSYERDPNCGVMVHLLKIADKTNNFETPISDNLYNAMEELLETDDPEEKFFKFSDKTAAKSLKRWMKAAEISPDRNISLHSIKKTSGDIVMDLTRDITITAKHTKNSVATCSKHYLGKNRSYVDQPSYYLLDTLNEVETQIDTLNKDQLIELIKQMGVGTVRSIEKMASKKGWL